MHTRFRVVHLQVNTWQQSAHRLGLEAAPGWHAPGAADSLLGALDGEGAVVALARSFRNAIHPGRARFAVFVVPAVRRHGIGSALIAHLPERLQIGTSAADSASMAFLNANGFTRIMTTRLGVIDPAKVPATTLDDELPAGWSLITAAERPDLEPAFMDLHEAVYREQHDWDAHVVVTDARALFLAESEYDPELQFGILAGDRLLAVGSVRTTADPGVLDLGWFGSAGIARDEDLLATRWLVDACLTAGRSREAMLSLEVDANHPTLNRVLGALPVTWHEPWLTYANER